MTTEPFMLRLRAYAFALIQCSIVFFPLYGLVNWITHQRSEKFHIFWQWELGIPLIPEMMAIYLSLNVLMVLPLFICNPSEIKTLGRSLVAGTLFAVVVFSVFPAELGFARPTHLRAFESAFQFLYSIDKPHNLFPSLHVTFSSLAVLAMTKRAGYALTAFLSAWLCLISVSVVLVWQHHVPDVIAGFFLALGVYRFYYLRALPT